MIMTLFDGARRQVVNTRSNVIYPTPLYPRQYQPCNVIAGIASASRAAYQIIRYNRQD